jgi:hypothetical protein
MNDTKKVVPVKDSGETFQEPITKEIALFEPTGYSGYTNKEIAILKSTVFKDCPDMNTLAMACHLAKTYQLDPFAKEFWAVNLGKKDNPNMIYEASGAGWRKLIRRQDNFKKMVVNAFYPSDTIEFDMINQKVVKHTTSIEAATEKPLGAYVYCEYINGDTNLAIAWWSEYGKEGKGKNKWDKEYETPWKYAQEMIKQKASAVFGRTYCGMSGLYAQGEVVTQEDEIEIKKKEMREVENEAVLEEQPAIPLP